MISGSLYSQSTGFDNDSETDVVSVSLPRSYRSLSLGMDFDTAKENLLREGRFDFRGDPDVSMQKNGSQALITSRGKTFIDRGFFQFEEGTLYLITLEFNRSKLDFFTIQQDLWGKYGEPGDISPQGMVWEDGKVRLSLEYPLTLKYLDLEIFNGMLEEETELKSFDEVSRERFLGDL